MALDKQQRKAMAQKAMEDREKDPHKQKGNGFAAIDAAAKKLESEN